MLENEISILNEEYDKVKLKSKEFINFSYVSEKSQMNGVWGVIEKHSPHVFDYPFTSAGLSFCGSQPPQSRGLVVRVGGTSGRPFEQLQPQDWFYSNRCCVRFIEVRADDTDSLQQFCADCVTQTKDLRLCLSAKTESLLQSAELLARADKLLEAARRVDIDIADAACGAATWHALFAGLLSESVLAKAPKLRELKLAVHTHECLAGLLSTYQRRAGCREAQA